MATTQLLRYDFSSSLGPGEELWVSFGPSVAFGQSAVTATAVANTGAGVNRTHVLKIDNINTTGVEVGPVGLATKDRHIGFAVKNNGSTVISFWSVYLGLIAA
jgi:hypothetical protein